MREILFRGKTLENDRWIDGDLRQWPSGAVGIHDEETKWTIKVDPETVGQYTGLTDKNGTKIFEGDVVRAVLMASKSTLPFEWPASPVVYKGSSFGLAYKSNIGFVRLDGFAPMVTFEVIGNIHDNPKLLEVQRAE